MQLLYQKYVNEGFDENGVLNRFEIDPHGDFNFGYDVVDEMAKKAPNKTAMVWCCLLYTSDLVKVHPRSGGRPGAFISIEDTGDPAADVRFILRRAGDVIPGDYLTDLNLVHLGHFPGHIEVENVAGVIAV